MNLVGDLQDLFDHLQSLPESKRETIVNLDEIGYTMKSMISRYEPHMEDIRKITHLSDFEDLYDTMNDISDKLDGIKKKKFFLNQTYGKKMSMLSQRMVNHNKSIDRALKKFQAKKRDIEQTEKEVNAKNNSSNSSSSTNTLDKEKQAKVLQFEKQQALERQQRQEAHELEQRRLSQQQQLEQQQQEETLHYQQMEERRLQQQMEEEQQRKIQQQRMELELKEKQRIDAQHAIDLKNKAEAQLAQEKASMEREAKELEQTAAKATRQQDVLKKALEEKENALQQERVALQEQEQKLKEQQQQYEMMNRQHHKEIIAMKQKQQTVESDYRLKLKEQEDKFTKHQALLKAKYSNDTNENEKLFNQAETFFNGSLTVDIDYLKAFALYETAATNGHARSMNALANMYINGLGCEANIDKASYWFNEGIKCANPDSMYGLALLVALQIHGETAGCNADRIKVILSSVAKPELNRRRKFSKEHISSIQYSVQLIRDAANASCADAACLLGEICYSGSWCGYAKAVTIDVPEAVRLFHIACSSGHARAENNLGVLYLNGVEGVLQSNHEVAADFFFKAAQRGFAVAQNNYAFCCEMGCGTKQSFVEAERWYAKAALQNHFGAMTNAACLLMTRANILHGMEGKQVEASKLYAEAAEMLFRSSSVGGISEANYYLGMLCEFGHGIAKDENRALLLYTIAAAATDDLATMSASGPLAMPLYDLKQVKQDSDIALKAVSRIAAIYFTNANKRYLRDEFPECELLFAKAMHYYKLAAKAGDASCQNALGIMYEEGQGVMIDYKSALKWYALAEKNGESDAAVNLSLMYRDGKGVNRSIETAIEYCKKAALKGNTVALGLLPILHQMSIGSDDDFADVSRVGTTKKKSYFLGKMVGKSNATSAVSQIKKVQKKSKVNVNEIGEDILEIDKPKPIQLVSKQHQQQSDKAPIVSSSAKKKKKKNPIKSISNVLKSFRRSSKSLDTENGDIQVSESAASASAFVAESESHTKLEVSNAIEPDLQSSEVPLLAFHLRDRIEARYQGNDIWYPGTIAAAHGDTNTFDLQYDDGDIEYFVHPSLIRHLEHQEIEMPLPYRQLPDRPLLEVHAAKHVETIDVPTDLQLPEESVTHDEVQNLIQKQELEVSPSMVISGNDSPLPPTPDGDLQPQHKSPLPSADQAELEIRHIEHDVLHHALPVRQQQQDEIENPFTASASGDNNETPIVSNLSKNEASMISPTTVNQDSPFSVSTEFLDHVRHRVQKCIQESGSSEDTTYRHIRKSVEARMERQFIGKEWRQWFRKQVDDIIQSETEAVE